jgi:hypothetical protein
MNMPPDRCYDPITPGFIAKTHGKDKRASTATSERQFAGTATREAQNVGFALSRRQHQEIRNAGAAFQDEQEPGGGEAGRTSKRSQRPQRGNAPDPDITFGEFLEGIALPFLRSKWKRSTAGTTENRITHHLGRSLARRSSPL